MFRAKVQLIEEETHGIFRYVFEWVLGVGKGMGKVLFSWYAMNHGKGTSTGGKI